MSELRDTRLEKAKALKNLGQGPYGLNFRPTDTSYALQEKYSDLPNGEEKQEEVSIAGRITSRRVMGKLAFFTLADETGTIQLFLEKATLNQTENIENPNNNFEPFDSSAATIAAQGLIRLGNYLVNSGEKAVGSKYRQAGLTVAETLFSEPYLSTSPKHQGLILHSIYHRPNGWDYIPRGKKIPCGESSMWGDYHARELALMLLREVRGECYLAFFDY